MEPRHLKFVGLPSPVASARRGRYEQGPDATFGCQLLRFVHTFTNSAGKEIAGIWFDDNEGVYRISTVPVITFKTMDLALRFWRQNCDPESGMQSMRRKLGSSKEDSKN